MEENKDIQKSDEVTSEKSMKNEKSKEEKLNKDEKAKEKPNKEEKPKFEKAKKEKKPSRRQLKKEKKQRWKQKKASIHEERKEKYKDAPFLTKLVCVHMRRHWVLSIIIILLLMIAHSIYSNRDNIKQMFNALYFATLRDSSLGDAFIDEYPVDDEGLKKVDAYPSVEASDTWTICVYMIGSNLEDGDENDLSDYMQYVSKELQNESLMATRENLLKKNVGQFSEEMEKNGLELPAYLSEINVPQETEEEEESSGNERAMITGASSADLSQMTEEVWPENIQIVIQPGGATRWGNEAINPNRTQRFLYKNGEFKMVEDMAYKPASDPDTLSDFLTYCKDNYPADHQMLILWDHGSGAFGYGHDTITGDHFDLAEIRTALDNVYEPNIEDPAFDIIGFDACLMSSIEVTHALYGFAEIYALSEETEPADGWDYATFLRDMKDDPTMSPAKVASKIADANVNSYIRENAVLKITGTEWSTTFAAIDAKYAEELYQAYGELTEAQLKDAAKDISVLSKIGECCNNSTRMAADAYNVFNSVDLVDYAENMSAYYPDECKKILDLLDKTVIYHRENGIMDETSGMAVYIPGTVNSFDGLIYCLNYIYDICDQDSTRSLYYYKIAGCLNDDMQKYVKKITDDVPQPMDPLAFSDFRKADPAVDTSGYTVTVDSNIKNQVQNSLVELAYYDKDLDAVYNYGADDRTAYFDENGNLRCDFDGTWIFLNDQPLAVEVTSSNDERDEYRSHILFNDEEAWLIFSYDKATDDYKINGVRIVPTEGLFNDTVNYMVNTKSNVIPTSGDVITPLYKSDSKDFTLGSFRFDSDTENNYGVAVSITKNTKITRKNLKSGYYLTSAIVEDQRCDTYHSATVGYNVSSGKVTDGKIDSSFYEYGY